jgi:bacteriocin-like protein
LTDDFIILSDAELDQVSGGDNPYVPPHHKGHHDPGWYQQPEPPVSATPFRNLDFYLGN